ncbi:hypothetical protein H0E87_020275, partial [Populus deltoides]
SRWQGGGTDERGVSLLGKGTAADRWAPENWCWLGGFDGSRSVLMREDLLWSTDDAVVDDDEDQLRGELLGLGEGEAMGSVLVREIREACVQKEGLGRVAWESRGRPWIG